MNFSNSKGINITGKAQKLTRVLKVDSINYLGGCVDNNVRMKHISHMSSKMPKSTYLIYKASNVPDVTALHPFIMQLFSHIVLSRRWGITMHQI